MIDMNLCFNCKKKLKIINFKCKCNHIFCEKCKYPYHNCSFNYQEEYKKKLIMQNPKITNDKINKIV